MRRPASDRRPAALLLDGVLVLVAIVGGAVLLARLAGAVLGLELVTFASGSMSPAFPQGAVAVAQRTPLDAVRIGDVVTIDRTGQMPITHRVVSVRHEGGEDVLRLRGDANRREDPSPYVVDHVSRVVLPLPAPLWALRMVDSPLVMIVAVLLAALAVVWGLWPRGGSAGRPATA